MPKQRKPENRGLPARWCLRHGAYYYQVPIGLESFWEGKKLFRLGKTLPDAYKEWARRVNYLDKSATIGQLLERYTLQVIPTKAASTQANNNYRIKSLTAVFGKVALTELRPQDVYMYADKRKSKEAALAEIRLLSHAFTKAVEWGYIDRHPFKGEVRLESSEPRTRYVEDWEIVECLAVGSKRKQGSVKMLQAYIRIKLLTGMRRGDLLSLTEAQIKDDGIHITARKTKKRTGRATIYEWTTELRQAVAMARAARPIDITPYLFCTKHGRSYVDEETGRAEGWASIWQRFMKRVLKETKVELRFTEHDLRAKAGSDAESLEHARALLSHADSRLTQKVYRRKPERVKPGNSTKGI